MKIKQSPLDFKVEEVVLKDSFSKISDQNGEFYIIKVKHTGYGSDLARKEIARKLQISQNKVNYCGRKDKRALVIQYFSVFGVKFEDIRDFSCKDIEIVEIYFRSSGLDIGEHIANKFEIVVREMDQKNYDVAINNFEKITKFGFVNYFGMQRFGGERNITAKIGKFILQKKYMDAVFTILKTENDFDSEELKLERRKIDLLKNNFDEIVNINKNVFPRSEKIIIEKMVKVREEFIKQKINVDENYFLRIVKSFRKNMIVLYIHAFQSFLWNETLNRLKLELKNDFKREITENLNNELILVGHDSELSKGENKNVNKIILRLLDEENITTKDFYNEELFEMKFLEQKRKVFCNVSDFEISELETDELNDSKLKFTVKFEIEKGAYATEVLSKLLGQKF